MKITPTKDYKKPLYALGLTTAMIAVAVTGCTDPDSKTKSRRHHRRSNPTEVQYEGGLTIADPDVELMGETDVEIPPTTENIQFEGEMDIWTDGLIIDLELRLLNCFGVRPQSFFSTFVK